MIEKELKEWGDKTLKLQAEGFVCMVEMNCLFNLGNKEELIKKYYNSLLEKKNISPRRDK